MITIVRWALNWLIGNGTAKLYLSQTPLGRHLGGHDIQQIANEYVILDVRVSDRIIVFGFFQIT